MGRLLSALRRIEARTEVDRLEWKPGVAAVATVETAPAETAPWPEESVLSWADAFNYSPPTEYSEVWSEDAPASENEFDDNVVQVDESPATFNAVQHPADTSEGTAERDRLDNMDEPAEAVLASVENLLPEEETVEAVLLAASHVEPPFATAEEAKTAGTFVSQASATLELKPNSMPQAAVCQAPDAATMDAKLALTAEMEHPVQAVLIDQGVGPGDGARASAQLDEREVAEESEEPPATVKLPGFGRPPRRGRGTEAASRLAGSPPSLVPFKPAAQRPYREVCANIVSSLPAGKATALVLAWTDEDLDHAMLAARLAETFADRMEDPVLLIDLGAKRRLSNLLDAPALGSLTEAMAGQVSWRDLIVQTGTAGLCVLPTGPRDFDADPVAFARLIEACKEDFGIVLITGGTLGVMPENILLASDAAVLLVEAGCTSQAAALGALQRLRRCGAEVLGCVMTGASI